MAVSTYLDHYLDINIDYVTGLDNLPGELQRNFTLMRDLDQRTQDHLKDIDQLAEDYLKQIQFLNTEKKNEKLDKIEKLFDKMKDYGDDKVQLAIQTYELVDKHIRRLDSDLARFEDELKDKTPQAFSSDSESQKKRGRKPSEKDKRKTKSKIISSDEESVMKKKAKIQTQLELQFPVTNTLPVSITHPSDVLDMPVDPNEPTYCLCHQVSYGEMIGCDNPDCPIEWFHFACVGLMSKPKGKWYCPKCSPERKKK